MAFFKFRTADGPGAPRQPESIETMRRRARHRLIGATVLVLAGVVGFPLLFDTQPRPIPVDIPIEIPDRNKAKPLPVPSRVTAAPTASGRVSAPPPPAAVAPEQQREAEAPAPKAEPAPPAKQDAAPRSKVEVKPDARAQAAADEGSKAKALPQGTGAKDAAPGDGRFVVQVGAFADPAKAREARARVERAGLKTYTHVADTKDGKRIRVRVGPFPTRAEADRAASKIKGLDMPAAILTL